MTEEEKLALAKQIAVGIAQAVNWSKTLMWFPEDRPLPEAGDGEDEVSYAAKAEYLKVMKETFKKER